MRTFGTVKQVRFGPKMNGYWLKLEPHVALRFKRMFPQVKARGRDMLEITATLLRHSPDLLTRDIDVSALDTETALHIACAWEILKKDPPMRPQE